MTFTIVERPRGGTAAVPDALLDALTKTVNNDKAVQLKLKSHGDFVTWQANVRAKLKSQHNLRLRTKFNKATLNCVCWAEPFEANRTVSTDVDLGVTSDANGYEDTDA